MGFFRSKNVKYIIRPLATYSRRQKMGYENDSCEGAFANRTAQGVGHASRYRGARSVAIFRPHSLHMWDG